jgi:hypothetical protein
MGWRDQAQPHRRSGIHWHRVLRHMQQHGGREQENQEGDRGGRHAIGSAFACRISQAGHAQG